MTPRRPPKDSLLHCYHLLSYDAIDSTNEEARRLARGGASHGAVIWAQSQTEGRGRLDRPWVSKPGNLFVSLLLKPEKPIEHLPQLSFVTSLAAIEALAPVVGTASKLALKWPNDILFEDRKMGGILLETEPSEDKYPWVIVGFGLNIDSFPPDSKVQFPATCLKSAGIEIISAKIVLSRFLSHFVECYDRWAHDGFEPIREAWLHHAWRRGKKLQLMQGTEAIEGIFEGIDEEGRITLKTGNKRQTLSAGDITAGGVSA